MALADMSMGRKGHRATLAEILGGQRVITGTTMKTSTGGEGNRRIYLTMCDDLVKIFHDSNDSTLLKRWKFERYEFKHDVMNNWV